MGVRSIGNRSNPQTAVAPSLRTDSEWSSWKQHQIWSLAVMPDVAGVDTAPLTCWLAEDLLESGGPSNFRTKREDLPNLPVNRQACDSAW